MPNFVIYSKPFRLRRKHDLFLDRFLLRSQFGPSPDRLSTHFRSTSLRRVASSRSVEQTEVVFFKVLVSLLQAFAWGDRLVALQDWSFGALLLHQRLGLQLRSRVICTTRVKRGFLLGRAGTGWPGQTQVPPPNFSEGGHGFGCRDLGFCRPYRKGLNCDKLNGFESVLGLISSVCAIWSR